MPIKSWHERTVEGFSWFPGLCRSEPQGGRADERPLLLLLMEVVKDPEAVQLEAVQRVLAPPDDNLVSRLCYIMLARLEPSLGDSEIAVMHNMLHARP